MTAVRIWYLKLSKTLCFTVVVSWYLKVRVHDDNGSEVQRFESGLSDDDFREQPPFMVPQDVEDHVSRQRYRRYDHKENKKEENTIRTEPECSKTLEKARIQSKKRPIQLAYIVEPGEPVRLMCHYCGHPEKWYKKLFWYRLLRRGNKRGAFFVEPIEMTIQKTKRFSVTYDHTLIINNTKLEDADTYFCIQKKDRVIGEKMDNLGIQRMFTATDRFRFYYHVDVVSTSKIPARIVSVKESKWPLPLGPTKDANLNLRYYTLWGKWSHCSVCDQPGESRRRGRCTAKLLNNKTMTDPPLIFYALNSFPVGMPCESTMFLPYAGKMSKRGDEIEVKSCKVDCGKFIKNGTTKRVLVQSFGFTLKDSTYVKTINVTIDSKAIMECPGATLDDMVYWVNNSNYISVSAMRDLNGDRADIDAYGVLRIYKVKPWDKGMYQCWYRAKKRAVVHLNVYVPPGAPWKQYLTYLLLSYTVDFWIFLALIYVRHKFRQQQTPEAQQLAKLKMKRKQQNIKQPRKGDSSISSDDDSTIRSSDDTGSEIKFEK